MSNDENSRDRRRGQAWLALCGGLALHVADEALNGFLDLYNPAVQAIRERYSFLPLPTFEFGNWLGMLVVAVAGLLALSLFVFAGRPWTRPASWFFGAVMLANGLGHLGVSVYMGEMIAGAWSSPVLVAASCHLLWVQRKA